MSAESSGKKGRFSSLLRASSGVAFATFCSRILGLLRVRLEAMVLGGGELASGWFLAFAIPNLLRRILGEGALGNALMPLVAEFDAQGGKEKIRKELGTVFFVLGVILAGIVILVSGTILLLNKSGLLDGVAFFSSERMRFVLTYLPLLMPYGFFMCLVGVASSVLNYCKEFFLPALGALLLNIFLISGLGAAYFLRVQDVRQVIGMLTLLVLLSGFIQLLLMLFLMHRNGTFPLLRVMAGFAGFKSATVKKLFTIALPGMIGGIAVQISFLVDRLLAVSLGAQAVPALTFIDRLIDLPIGIFAVSLGSVLMASMSRSAAQGDMGKMVEELGFSMRQVFFFCVPMAAGVMFFHRPLMSVLCLGGRYTVSDLYAAEMVALFYGAGIPLFCLLKVINPAFYSRKNMKTPLAASCCAIVVNIVLNLILMRYLQQGGIALATVVAAAVNCTILCGVLGKNKLLPPLFPLVVSLIRAVFCAVVSVGGVYAIYEASRYVKTDWGSAVIDLAVTAGLFGVFYIGLSALFKSPELRELAGMFLHRGNKKVTEK